MDFNANTLTIKHTVSKVTKAVAKDKTKNASSRRSFPLLPEIKVMLSQLQEQERENRRLFGKQYQANDYLFKWDNGAPFSPDYVSQRFSRLLEVNDLPHIRFHDLRHSCASFLLTMGFSLKDIQEWLGHANIQVTANTYAHLDLGRKQDIAHRLSDRIL